jgi:S-formylglutathione hydrolase FrmB
LIGTVLSAVLLALCCVACNRAPDQATVQTISTTNAITISDIRFHSPAIDGILWYRIIVPSTRGTERLPVLYLLHGANSSPVEIMERSEIARLATTEHLAGVIPDGKYSYYTNHTGIAGMSMDGYGASELVCRPAYRWMIRASSPYPVAN